MLHARALLGTAQRTLARRIATHVYAPSDDDRSCIGAQQPCGGPGEHVQLSKEEAIRVDLFHRITCLADAAHSTDVQNDIKRHRPEGIVYSPPCFCWAVAARSVWRLQGERLLFLADGASQARPEQREVPRREEEHSDKIFPRFIRAVNSVLDMIISIPAFVGCALGAVASGGAIGGIVAWSVAGDADQVAGDQIKREGGLDIIDLGRLGPGTIIGIAIIGAFALIVYGVLVHRGSVAYVANKRIEKNKKALAKATYMCDVGHADGPAARDALVAYMNVHHELHEQHLPVPSLEGQGIRRVNTPFGSELIRAESVEPLAPEALGGTSKYLYRGPPDGIAMVDINEAMDHAVSGAGSSVDSTANSIRDSVSIDVPSTRHNGRIKKVRITLPPRPATPSPPLSMVDEETDVADLQVPHVPMPIGPRFTNQIPAGTIRQPGVIPDVPLGTLNGIIPDLQPIPRGTINMPAAAVAIFPPGTINAPGAIPDCSIAGSVSEESINVLDANLPACARGDGSLSAVPPPRPGFRDESRTPEHIRE